MAAKRAAFVLLSATASTLVASADPAPTQPVKPRMLATGAPACGNLVSNMGYKSYGPKPVCQLTATQLATGRSILAAVEQRIQEIRETAGIFDLVGADRDPSLTLSVEGRPRS